MRALLLDQAEAARAILVQHQVLVQQFDSPRPALLEIGNRGEKAPNFYWQQHRAGQTFGLEYGPTAICHCPKGAHGGHGAHDDLD